jgi:PKD repeat protein
MGIKIMKTLKFELLITLILFVTLIITCPLAHSYSYKDDSLYLAVTTNKNSYSIRELVIIQGTLKQGDLLISDYLVGIEVRDSSELHLPVTFRTLATGSISSTNWLINFTEIYPCDSNGNPKYSFNVKENLYIKGTVKNFDAISRKILVTVSLYDGNLIPLSVWYPISYELGPGNSIPFFFYAGKIPAWAYPGNATIYANIFSGFPKDGGTPYCPEKAVLFEIKRNPSLTYRSNPPTFYPSTNGTFIGGFRLSPESRNGTYTVYASAIKGPASIKNMTTFYVESSSSPPQASFFYTPIEPYVNMTVTFDASASTAEGYNDTIVKYEWNFGDGTSPPPPQTGPIITHKFKHAGTYIVTLNVTDNEGLWCITSKPITIKPPTGPRASYTWSPPMPGVNRTVTFDASASKPGWNGTAYTPIISYKWDFGDGNVTIVTTPKITHVYTREGNYTVTLTITDTGGLQDSVTHVVTVIPTPQLPGDINGDGIVNYLDAILLGAAFGSQPGDPNWNLKADINGDGIVNYLDAIILGANFGSTGY